MEYVDSEGNPLREGLYRHMKDKSYVLYLFNQDDEWKFQTPDSKDLANFPLSSAHITSKELEPVYDFFREIKRFKRIVSFLEKKLDEEIESRR